MTTVSKPIRVGDVVSTAPGKAEGSWRTLDRVGGSPYEIPVLIVHGRAPGPVLWINAGVHGDEYEGPFAAAKLYHDLEPDELAGVVVLTPVLNLPAFEAKTRTSPLDLLDLNRTFPGNRKGSPSQRLAGQATETMSEVADYVIDLHGGGLDKLILPYAAFHEFGGAGKEARAMAEATGVDLILGTPATTEPGGQLAGALVRKGVPAITIESGAEGRLRDEYVDVHYASILNVMHHLKMLNGPPRARIPAVRVTNSRNLFVDNGGLIRYLVKPKDAVKHGDVLAEVYDLRGNVIETLTSPQDGVVTLIKTSPAVFGGDRVVSISDLGPAAP